MTLGKSSLGNFLGVFLCSLMLAFAAAGSLVAQNTGTILGTIKDASGAVLPGAEVTAKNTETGISRSTTSGAKGEYRIPALAVGSYEVTATMTGFQTGVRQGIELSLGREAVVDFPLEVGAVTQQVTVTAEAPLINTTTATVSGLVDPKQMTTIPLNARSFIDLVPTQGYAVFADAGDQSATKGFGKKVSVTGTRYNQNLFLLDGADINDATGTAGSASGALAGVETVREFRVITNAYDAQYGKHTGGVISAITKNGTNQFHGSLFEYLRNIKMDAARWEDNAKNNGVKPDFKRNQFGGSFGGPIKKDKTFFFGSYEGLRQRQGATTTYNVLSNAAQAGTYRPSATGGCATDNPPTTTGPGCKAPIDPVMLGYMKAYPLPNLPCAGTTGGCLPANQGGDGVFDLANGTGQFSEAQTTPTTENYLNVRADHTLSDKNSFFGRINIDRANSFNPGLNTGAQSKTATLFYTMKDTHIFSPTLLAETLASYNRTRIDLFDVYLPGGQLPVFNFSGDPTTPGELSVQTLNSLGGSNTNPKAYIQNVFQFGEDLTYTHGSHNFKFGGMFERIQFNQEHNSFYQPGEFDFSGITQFMARQVNEAHFVTPGSDDIRGIRENVTGMYIQDDIKLRPSLTVNLGLRYEFISVPTEVNGKLATVRDLSFAHFYSINTFQTDTGDPYFVNPSMKNFAPRIGFAWTPFASGKTVLRGGAGEFHDQILPSYYQTAVGRIPPAFSVSELFDSTVVQLPASAACPANGQHIDFPNMYTSQRCLLVPGQGVQPQLDGFQFNVSQPAMYKWSMDIQQQMLKDATLDVGYAGTRGTHLVRGNLNLNSTPSCLYQPSIAGCSNIPAGSTQFILLGPSPVNITINPNLGRMRWRLTDGDSFYHALNATFKKRFTGGLQVNSSYTWSKSMDDSSTFTGGSDFNSSDRSAYIGAHERAPSAFDVTQSFFTTFTYELPGKKWNGVAGQAFGGWSLSGNWRISSGYPVNVSSTLPSLILNAAGQPVTTAGTGTTTFSSTNVDGSSINLIANGDQAKTSGTSIGCGSIAAGKKLGTPSQGGSFYFDPCQFAYITTNRMAITPLNGVALNDPNLPFGFFQGNVGRNVLRAPGISTLDTTLAKSFKLKWLGESGLVDFHAEFYNILNKPQFGVPALSIFSNKGALNATAGQITTTSTRSNARQVQLALRLEF